MKIRQLKAILEQFDEEKEVFIMGADIEYFNDSEDCLVLDEEPVEDGCDFKCYHYSNLT